MSCEAALPAFISWHGQVPVMIEHTHCVSNIIIPHLEAVRRVQSMRLPHVHIITYHSAL